MTDKVRDMNVAVVALAIVAVVACGYVMVRGPSNADQMTYGPAVLAMGALWAVFALSYEVRPRMSDTAKCFVYSAKARNTAAMCTSATLASLITLTLLGVGYCSKNALECKWMDKAFEGSMVLGVVGGILAGLAGTFTLMIPASELPASKAHHHHH